MKKVIVAFIFAIGLTVSVSAQEGDKKDAPANDQNSINTIFSDARPSHLGGWGSPVLKVTNFAPAFNGPFGLLVGGEGGVIVNRSLYFGGAGYGLVTDLDKYHITGAAPGNNVHLGYGGFMFKYHFFPTSVVNFSIGTLIGAGSYGSGITPASIASIKGSAVFAAEPEIYLYINLAKFCRFGVGGSYRMLVDDGTAKNGLRAMDMWGYSINVMFQFGRF